jgi:superfamily II DNA or RNA helicase
MSILTKTTKRPLILREYQNPASDFAMEHDIAILGVAPNGGKTEISIHVLCRYLNLNPKAKILILTHSTNVLKDNFTSRLDELDLPFTYSTTFDSTCQVHVCLPHSEHLIKGKYDLLLVDEAHENYLADRVQRIVTKVGAKKQLLLTGTPSKFIKKGGYNIYTLAANAIPAEYFAKLQIELVASNYNWAKELNNDYEIRSQYRFKTNETQKTLENILLKLIDRVRVGLSAEEFNNPGVIAKLKQWGYTYKKLGKTIIICRSIKQAADVNNMLKTNGVNSMVSDSETDKDSIEIANFKENKYDVLVVVDRARLGYSDNNLYNIIDMSGSHNPNVLYQIFARVLRGTPEMQKYYLKVTTQEYGMMDFTHACVSAALMLTDNKYLSTFNGSNFNGIKIPVIKKPSKTNDGVSGSNGNGTKPTKKKLIFPEFTNDVIDMFKNIIHSLDQPVSIYKLTTIGEVRAILSGRTVWTEEDIIASAKGDI